jgi:two-component system response regulator HydG
VDRIDDAAARGLFERLAETASGAVDLKGVERRLMHEAVERTGGNLAAAARLLGLTRAQLAYRLRVVEQRKAD